VTAPAKGLRIGFANMNWGTSQAKDDNIVADLIGLGCLLLGLVEAKVDNVREMVPTGWHVAQSLKSAARQGSAAAWDYRAVRVTDRQPLRIGVLPGTARMLARWLRIIDVKIDGQTTRVIICHWPPARFRFLWPAFTRHVMKHVHASAAGRAGRWLVMADFNMPITKAANLLGGTAEGTGIVGVVTGSGLRATAPTIDHRVVARRWTDHPGVVVDITLTPDTKENHR